MTLRHPHQRHLRPLGRRGLLLLTQLKRRRRLVQLQRKQPRLLRPRRQLKRHGLLPQLPLKRRKLLLPRWQLKRRKLRLQLQPKRRRLLLQRQLKQHHHPQSTPGHHDIPSLKYYSLS